MILSDDDFEEPEIDFGVHIQNIQNNVNLLILKNDVTKAIENDDLNLLEDLIENQWDGKTIFYSVNDDNIKTVINFSLEALGDDANLNWIDTSNITDMSYMFYESVFNGDISCWNVFNVENMNGMFYSSKFNGDISKWNVSSVTNMERMFYYSKFNGDISGWDVSKVINMSYMFYGSKFNQDISKWDVSNVTNMYSMFEWSRFNQDISSWNMSNVTNRQWMFDNCYIKEEYKPKFKK